MRATVNGCQTVNSTCNNTINNINGISKKRTWALLQSLYQDQGKCALEDADIVTNGVSFRVGKFFGHPEIQKQKKITEHILTHDELTLDDVVFNPISLEQTLKVIRWELTNNKLFGVYNLANEGATTHYRYGSFINGVLGSNKKITRIDKLQRQFTNYGYFNMSCEKIKQYITLTDWRIDMIEYLDKHYNI